MRRRTQTIGLRLVLSALLLPALAWGEEPPKAEVFAPPTLEKLQKVRWVRRDCVFPVEHLWNTVKGEKRLATPEEALALKNTSAENNARILSALGGPPANDDEVDWEATFNRYLGSEVQAINPIFGSTRFDFSIEDLLFIMPVQYDWDLRVYGDLNVIESWETSEDSLMDKVVLRRDLRWTDGKPVTARDVEFTYEALMSPQIRGVARKSLAEGLRGVKAYDDRTVVYFQREALPMNPIHIAWPIVARHVFEKSLKEDPTMETSEYHLKVNKDPASCGPYRLVRWTPGQEFLFERRTEWFMDSQGQRIRAKPFFKQVRFRVLPDNTASLLAFLAGETDETPLISEQWTKETVDQRFYDRGVKIRGDEWNVACIGWNANSVPPNPFFDDKRVRLAMAYAFDHDFCVNQLYSGVVRPGKSFFHPDAWMAAKDLKSLHRDLDRAEQLLDEAGWKDSDSDGIRDKSIDGTVKPFRFTVTYPSAGTSQRVALLMQANFKAVGVECNLRPMEWVAFNKNLKDRQPEAFLWAVGTGVDPDTIRNLWHTDAIKNGRNYVGYSNPRVDKLLEKGSQELDRAKRATIYAEIDRILYEDHPLTVLFYQSTLWAFSKSLRGYRVSPKGVHGLAPGFYSIWKKLEKK